MAEISDQPITKMVNSEQDIRLIGAPSADFKILCFHGGGGVAGSPEMLDRFAHTLAGKGDIRTAAASYRVLNTAQDATFEDMLKDGRRALAWARSEMPDEGLWVLGASFGALLALDAVLDDSDGVAGLILLNPVTDTGPGGFANRVIDPNQHAQASPLSRYKDNPVLSKLRCLIVHGENDDVVPVHASQAFADLWPAGACRLVKVPNAEHGFFNRGPRTAQTATQIRNFIGAAGQAKLPSGARLLCCVGGQKAGTSWLYDQFAQSPEVNTGQVKERHYFDALWLNDQKTFVDAKVERLSEAAASVQAGFSAKNAKPLRTISRLTQQLAPFSSNKGDHSSYIKALSEGRGDADVLVDFTPAYCGLSADHFQDIEALGDVRFIYILRDPVARMWSQIRMKFRFDDPDTIAEKCAEHAHMMCDSGQIKKIFRADYARTLAALDGGASQTEIVFYEHLFEQATFDRLAAFAGIESYPINADRKVNEGRSTPLPPDVEQKMLHALAPQYEAVMARFKEDVPDAWHDRFDKYEGKIMQRQGKPAQRIVRRTVNALRSMKKQATPRAHVQPQVAFLHIPKTAGQSIIQELHRVCGDDKISPVRTHTQAAKDSQFPPGYRVYAGHIDWVDLESLEDDRFSFSVLRNPRERVASFYFYLKREAEMLSVEDLAQKENTGKRNLLSMSIDDYFFGGKPAWQTFIHDHYDNFYCSYFNTRRIRGWRLVKHLQPEELIANAVEGAKAVSKIYGLSQLDRLEADLSRILNATVNLQSTRVNTGPPPTSGKRWNDLMALFEQDESRAKMDAFVEHDEAFLRALGLESELR